MKHIVLFAALTVAAFAIACEGDINQPLAPTTLIAFEINGVAERLSEAGITEYFEVSGRVQYSIKRVYGEEELYEIILTTQAALKAKGLATTAVWNAAGTSADFIMLDQDNEYSLVKNYPVKGITGEPTLNIEFTIVKEGVGVKRMWIS